MSVTSLRPNTFQPDLTKGTDERVAEALEFIAARMGMIEYDTSMMRMQIMQLPHLLGAMVRTSGQPGKP